MQTGMTALRAAFGVLGIVICVMAASPADALDISGAGSTFVYPILSKWAEAYKDKTGVSVNYQSIGARAGASNKSKSRIRLWISGRRTRPCHRRSSTNLGRPLP